MADLLAHLALEATVELLEETADLLETADLVQTADLVLEDLVRKVDLHLEDLAGHHHIDLVA